MRVVFLDLTSALLSEGKPAVAVLNAVLPRGTKHEQAADAVDAPGWRRLLRAVWVGVLPEKSQPCGSFIEENQPSWRQSTYLFP